MTHTATLLVELGCEELPAGSVLPMAEHLTKTLQQSLKDAGFGAAEARTFATPRRIAALIGGVQSQQPEQHIERRGPAVKAAFDAEGKPTKAAEGFARSCGVSVDQLQRQSTDKGEWLSYASTQPGIDLCAKLNEALPQIFAQLPMPKQMRWADSSTQFLRPVRTLTALHGSELLAVSALGLQSSRQILGHRFHAPEPIELGEAEDYAARLQSAFVMADFNARRALIEKQIHEQAAAFGGQLVFDAELLDEVTALVEWPVALTGQFDASFLDVPKEALIQTMQENQRYFAIVDAQGDLMSGFVAVSNIESHDPSKVQEGNERVIRPRFADAMFFWEQDKKKPLEAHLDTLKRVVFQDKLGSLHDKTERLVALSGEMARQLGVDVELAQRAALLSKCDLMSEMVYEFPEMQGIAGQYYARLAGENDQVATALEEQYFPKQAGDDTPESAMGQILSLAEKLDTLCGIFGIGQKPTGTKDPFGLRRASLGLLRILIERELDLDLPALIENAKTQLAGKLDDPSKADDALHYIWERLRAYYQEQGIGGDIVDAVMAVHPTRPLDFHKRAQALQSFQHLPEAESLAAANKRIGNLLKKVDGTLPESVSEALLTESEEHALWQALCAAQTEVHPKLDAGDYESALKALASLREPVDAFFDNVLVMAEDEAVRTNRMALLQQLYRLCTHVADLSKLQSGSA